LPLVKGSERHHAIEGKKAKGGKRRMSKKPRGPPALSCTASSTSDCNSLMHMNIVRIRTCHELARSSLETDVSPSWFALCWSSQCVFGGGIGWLKCWKNCIDLLDIYSFLEVERALGTRSCGQEGTEWLALVLLLHVLQSPCSISLLCHHFLSLGVCFELGTMHSYACPLFEREREREREWERERERERDWSTRCTYQSRGD